MPLNMNILTFGAFLESRVIVNKKLCDDTPQQNGITKRKIDLILVVVVLNVSNECVKIFWGDVLRSAFY